MLHVLAQPKANIFYVFYQEQLHDGTFDADHYKYTAIDAAKAQIEKLLPGAADFDKHTDGQHTHSTTCMVELRKLLQNVDGDESLVLFPRKRTDRGVQYDVEYLKQQLK